jgi:DNA-binding NarL/FixJ family response regulator
MGPLRILIADDNPLIRHQLRTLFEKHADWTICGEATDGLEAVDKATSLRPDVVLLDISMPNLDGLTAVPLMREKAPDSAILILTFHESLNLARIAANAGAWGYITRSLLSTELIPTLETLHAAIEASKSTPAVGVRARKKVHRD